MSLVFRAGAFPGLTAALTRFSSSGRGSGFPSRAPSRKVANAVKTGFRAVVSWLAATWSIHRERPED